MQLEILQEEGERDRVRLLQEPNNHLFNVFHASRNYHEAVVVEGL